MRKLPRGFVFKGHGLGNDYAVVQGGRCGFRLSVPAVRLFCDRHFGVGSDGILVHERSRRGDARMRVLNPDGSEAQKSGNGARIFALYLRRYGLPGHSRYLVETKGGMVRAVFRGGLITVDMGKATFMSRALPMRGPVREAVREKLRVGGQTLIFTGVSVGNPHAVFYMKKLDLTLLRKLGPLIENHRLFPERTNVQFAQRVSAGLVKAVIWERGAGETQASGSSACAVAAAGRKLGLLGPDVTVSMPGGNLKLGISPSWDMTMTGPAEEVYSGSLPPSFLRALSRSR